MTVTRKNSSGRVLIILVNTYILGMKFGKKKVTGLDRYLLSWKSADDPSKGKFTNQMDLNGFPQPYLWNGLAIEYRDGPWNGLRFSGLPQLTKQLSLSISFC